MSIEELMAKAEERQKEFEKFAQEQDALRKDNVRKAMEKNSKDSQKALDDFKSKINAKIATLEETLK